MLKNSCAPVGSVPTHQQLRELADLKNCLELWECWTEQPRDFRISFSIPYLDESKDLMLRAVSEIGLENFKFLKERTIHRLHSRIDDLERKYFGVGQEE